MTVSELLAALADADPQAVVYWAGEDGSGFPRVTSAEDWGGRVHLGDHVPQGCPYCLGGSGGLPPECQLCGEEYPCSCVTNSAAEQPTGDGEERPEHYMHRFVKPDPGDLGPYCMFCGEHRDHFVHTTAEQPTGDAS